MKARFFALAALVLGLASCQNDFDGANVGAGGEVDFQLSVAAPELATRAGVDGVTPDGQADLNSAYGAIDYLQGGTAGDTLRVDWDDVDLRYVLEVYDVANGAIVGTAPVKDRQVIIVDEYQPVTFELRLVPKRNYRFVVFADFVEQDANDKASFDVQNELGLHHTLGNTLQEITVKRTEENAINNEVTDAYFAFKDFTITDSKSNDIVLQRPYGKLRVIATDLHELNLNSNPDAVKVEYTALQPQTLNAVTGEIGAIENTVTTFVSEYNEGVCKEFDENNGKLGLQNHFYNAGYDALNGANHEQHTNANGDVRHTHMTLFTDYILASEQQHSVHFTMTVYDDYANNSEIKSTTFNTDIPVQRNYLTTVIGNVLTTATEVEVRIDDNFSNGTEWNPEEDDFDIELVEVDSAKTLQEALDNYVNGQTIFLVGDIEGNVVANQVEGKDYVIDGNGYNFDGVFEINGDARWDGSDSITIQNINFTTSKSNINFIDANDNKKYGKNYNYAHNVTIKDCSFNATGEGVVAIKIRQGKNIHVANCVANGTTRAANASGLHSFAQLYGCANVTFEGLDINAQSGVSFGTSTNNKFANSVIVAEGYGIRADASVETTLYLEDVDITANLPIIARKTDKAYRIKLAKCDLTAPGYQIVFTSGDDDKAFVAPADCGYGVDCNDKTYSVFPGNNVLYAYTADGLQTLLNNATDGTTIHVAADITGDVTATQKSGVKVTIEGHGHNYAGVILVDGKSATYTTAGLTIKELNFNADSISADACIRLGDGTNATRYTCNVTVDSCIFDVPGAVGVKSYTGGDKNLTIKDCTATVKAHSLVQAKGIDGILVEKCNVYSKNGLNFNNSTNVTVDQCTVDVKGYAVRYGESSGGVGAAETYYIKNSSLKSAGDEGDAVIILRGTADYATLTITETTIDGTPAIVNNAKDAKVIIDGKKMVEAASQTELDVIVAAGVDVAVTLADGIYALPSFNNGDVAISGGKDVIITINKPNLSGSDVTFTGVTVKGSGYATGVQHVNTVTYNNVTIDGEMCLYGAKNVFNNCTFNLAANQYIWTYGSDVTEFNNCTFNTAGKAILVYNEGDGACEVKVDGCKFYASAAGYAGDIKNQACAAVEINNFQNPTGTNNGAAHKVTYTNTNQYDNTKFSGGWRIKNYEAGNPITVNGVEYTQIAIDGKLMTIDAEKNVSVL